MHFACTDPTEHLSPLVRLQENVEKRKEKRKEKREQQKEKRRLEREAAGMDTTLVAHDFGSLTNSQFAGDDWAPPPAKRIKRMEESECRQRIVIDMSWEDLMTHPVCYGIAGTGRCVCVRVLMMRVDGGSRGSVYWRGWRKGIFIGGGGGGGGVCVCVCKGGGGCTCACALEHAPFATCVMCAGRCGGVMCRFSWQCVARACVSRRAVRYGDRYNAKLPRRINIVASYTQSNNVISAEWL